MKLLEKERNREAAATALARAVAPLRDERLRWPVCRERAERQDIDPARAGTVCQGCRHDLSAGCPNPRVWSLAGGSSQPVTAEALVYCKHYDCGCALCASLR